MVKRASPYLLERILILRKTMSYRKLQAFLLLEGIKISKNSISKICIKYKTEKKIVNRFRKPKPKKIEGDTLEYLDSLITNNRDIKIDEITTRIRYKYDIWVSNRTAYRAAKNVNWIKKCTRYCQIVSEVNSRKRYLYACFCLKNQMTFDDCIFIDKSGRAILGSEDQNIL